MARAFVCVLNPEAVVCLTLVTMFTLVFTGSLYSIDIQTYLRELTIAWMCSR